MRTKGFAQNLWKDWNAKSLACNPHIPCTTSIWRRKNAPPAFNHTSVIAPNSSSPELEPPLNSQFHLVEKPFKPCDMIIGVFQLKRTDTSAENKISFLSPQVNCIGSPGSLAELQTSSLSGIITTEIHCLISTINKQAKLCGIVLRTK